MDRDSVDRRPRFSWLPIAVLTLSFLGTLVGWLVVRADEKSHILKTTMSAVASVRADLGYDMNTWIHEQVGLADLWKIEEPSFERWSAFANTYLEHHPGCLKLEWLDPDYREQWIMRPSGSRHSELSLPVESRDRLLATVLQSGKPAISLILTTDSGDKYWLAAVPIYRQKQFRGFVLASSDAQRSLDAMMDDIQVLNFSVAVEVNGKESYRLVGGTDQNKNEWQTEFDVPLPGNTWRMQIWPKPEAMNEMRSRLPLLTLLFGTILSLLLAWIAHSYHALRLEIAERRRAEEALRASEARFSGILTISADAVISTNAGLRVILYNQAAETTFGYTAEEMLGQPVHILIPERFREVHKHHVARFAQSEESSLRLSERRPVTGLRKDGSEFPMAASVSKLNIAGETIFTVICSDVTDAVRAEEQLRKSHEELEVRVRERTAELEAANQFLQMEILERKRAEEEIQDLSRRMLRVQEEERRNLARELHDGPTQSLLTLSLHIGRMHRDPSVISPVILEEWMRLAEQCANEMRTVSYLLHPPLLEELGLSVTLESYVEGFARRTGIQAVLRTQGELDHLGFDVDLGVFRIIQEALSNVRRHSGSRTALVEVSCDGGTLQLQITDQGRGIPPDSDRSGVGLASMHERARLLKGKLAVETGSSGTTIKVELPVSVSERSSSRASA